MDNVVTVHNAQWHAVQICDAWQSSVEAIIETGRRIEQAKGELDHGEFLDMVHRSLPFVASTAQRLMAIASDPRISNAAHVQYLPPSWGSLYELTKLDDEQFEHGIEAGIIRPDVQRREITAILKTPLPQNEIHEDCVSSLDELIQAGRKFGVVYADPPWQYGNTSTRSAVGKTSGGVKNYPTMPLADICNLPVSDVVADRAHLHIWTTNAFLFDAKSVIEAWGFEYRSCMVWVKPQMGIGNYWRVSHEFLLLGIRGESVTFPSHLGLKSWHETDRLKHSEKPQAFREMIEKTSPTPRIELFARKLHPEWSAWGNEIEGNLYDERSQ